VRIGEKSFCALNDAVIHRGGFSRMLKFVLYIEDIAINDILSDGLIVSTPTGSTAYSFSAGGPIVDPSLDVLIVTPICPHDLNSRSLIIPASKTVRIVIKEAQENEAMLTIDGQMGHMVNSGDEIVVKGGGKVGLIRAEGSIFYEKLRRKLFNKSNGGC
jgi:NAD+ kinase